MHNDAKITDEKIRKRKKFLIISMMIGISLSKQENDEIIKINKYSYKYHSDLSTYGTDSG